MLKPVFIALTLASLSLPVFAQSDSSDNSNYAQRMLSQSSAQAVMQFDKNYPKPPPPVIPNPPKGETGAGPTDTYKQQPTPPKNITPPSNINTNNSPWANSANTQPAVTPPPKINIDTGKSSQRQSPSQQNIFMPSGSGAANTNPSAPNPYR